MGFAGLVSVDALRSASERGVSRVADTLSNATYRTTPPETSLVELCTLVRDGDVPLAVVDGHGVFLGTIDAVEVLAAIGGNRHDAQD